MLQELSAGPSLYGKGWQHKQDHGQGQKQEPTAARTAAQEATRDCPLQIGSPDYKGRAAIPAGPAMRFTWLVSALWAVAEVVIQARDRKHFPAVPALKRISGAEQRNLCSKGHPQGAGSAHYMGEGLSPSSQLGDHGHSSPVQGSNWRTRATLGQSQGALVQSLGALGPSKGALGHVRGGGLLCAKRLQRTFWRHSSRGDSRQGRAQGAVVEAEQRQEDDGRPAEPCAAPGPLPFRPRTNHCYPALIPRPG